MNSGPIYFGLLRRRQCLLPTLRGWLFLLALSLAACVLAAVLFVRNIYGFLTVVDPVPGGILVVEGWASDFVMRKTLEEFRRNSYAKIFVTGGTTERGVELVRYRTQAEVGAAVLIQMGLDPAQVQALPPGQVLRDRTYTSAVELRRVLIEQGLSTSRINIMTGDTHSRRTRLLFTKAFGPATRVGVVGFTGPEVDPGHWWATSDGFRSVTDELVAYTYARFLFRAP